MEDEKLNITGRFVRMFVDNTPLSILVTLMLILGGIFSYMQLKTEGFPEVPVSFAMIQTVLPGGTANDVEEQVTNRIEGAIKDVKDVKEISSSSQPNVSIVSVTFNEGVAIDGPLAEIRSKVQGVVLPEVAKKPEVALPNFFSPAYTVAITGSDATDAALKKAGDLFESEMTTRSEIASVTPVFPLKNRLLIKVDFAKLRASGVSLGQLSQALSGASINYPVGQVILDGREQPVVVDGQIASLDELRTSVIGVKVGTVTPVRLSDVATLRADTTDEGKVERVVFADGDVHYRQPGLLYGVKLKNDVSLLKVDEKLKAFMTEISDNGSLGAGMRVVVMADQAKATQDQVGEIVHGAFGEKYSGPVGFLGYLFGGIWLLILALLLFLNWRVALIGALAIPLSFFFTFISLRLFGINLNTITLFSLVLVLGLIVDPAIVVLESMQRFLDLGHSRRDAVLEAIGSVGNGVFIAVVTSIIVFVPFGLVSGIFGEIIKFIPLTVVPALIASYLVPMAILTWLGRIFLRGHVGKAGKVESKKEELWRFSSWLIRANQAILKRVWLQILIVILALVVPIGVTGLIFANGGVKLVQFSQPDDVTSLMVTAKFDASRSEDDKQKIVRQVEQAVVREKEVKSAYIFDQSTKESIIWSLVLSDVGDRDETSTEIKDSLVASIGESELAKYKVSEEGIGPGGSDFQIQLQVYGNDFEKMKKAAVETGRVASAMPHVIETSDGISGNNNPETHIVLNRQKAESFGLNAFVIGQQLQAIYGESPVGRIYNPDNLETVDLILSGKDSSIQLDQSDIKDLVIAKSFSGADVKVGDIAAIKTEPSVPAIGHISGRRYLEVRVKVDDATANDQKALKTITDNIKKSWTDEKLAEYGLARDAVGTRGQNDDFNKSFTQLFQAIFAALFLTYVVLVLFFRSFLQPLIITFAVPLAFLGVFPALALVGGGQLGFLEMIGILTLIGIVENVGIFVIDYANRLRREGMSTDAAIAEATGVRFRPIFLTKITALGGLLPLAILSPFWRGLSVVVIAGILVSGILSLFTTPILYKWFSAKPRLRKRR